MQFEIEQYISNLISSQFPQFYQEQGPNFMLFMKAYYEWMESNTPLQDSSNNIILNPDGANTTPPIYAARQLFNYRDIDNTLEAFLDHFQRKYLYGIPFNVIINKRFLLKHILDVYRSKGSIQCYKLLFKLIYDQDVDVYLPSTDMLKPSDGTWYVPSYIEVSYSNSLPSFVGNQIVGLSSGVTAMVEGYVREPVNQVLTNCLYISNITPPNSQFTIGESLGIVIDQTIDPPINAPIVLGSLSSLNIIDGGYGLSVGDVLKVRVFPSNSVLATTGTEAIVKVSGTTYKIGAIVYSIADSGNGVTSNASIFNYFPNGTGTGAQFQLGPLTYESHIVYNTDLLCNYLNTQIGAATYGFPGNTSANSSTPFSSYLQWQNNIFGSIDTLAHVNNGINYTSSPSVFVQSTIPAQPMPGTVSYNTTSNVVTGSGTNFTYAMTPNTMIVLIANSANTLTAEQHIILSIANDTSLTLWDTPFQNSTASAQYEPAPAALPANLPTTSPLMHTKDGKLSGNNALVTGVLATGNGYVTNVVIVDSGINYKAGDFVAAYTFNSLAQPEIVLGGKNYTNGELLIFVDNMNNTRANGYITTNANGSITGVTMTSYGSAYYEAPNVAVQSATGSGALLTVQLAKVASSPLYITGTVNKSGIGYHKGYWTTTRGFLNADKYIQDSYFYQAFSYELKVATTIDQYKNILYNTFHPAGSEMFGEYYFIDVQPALMKIAVDETVSIINDLVLYYNSDATNTVLLTSDLTLMTSDSSNNAADGVNTN